MEEIIFVAYITTRNGKRIYASDYGLKAFPIKVQKNEKPSALDDSSDNKEE